MSERGTNLRQMATRQIVDVISLLSVSGEAALRLPNRSRQKLGDGTVGASAWHTADSYHRIAGIVRASCLEKGKQGQGGGVHSERDHATEAYRVESIELPDLLDRLSAARDALSLLADLTDDQLDAVPAAGTARFCDGRRTLEQVVRGALSHQDRNVDALKAAVA